ncbi:MAG: serine/threonine-protein phosphatase [Candidatus Eremiobacteraeota bacterium]|nr:serine/threonine-protein phosphatase [Candidatus Eremiobacteraeota bacterium]
MEVAVTTDVGSAQRHNDDAWCAEQLHRNVTLLAVADGFGRPGGASSSSIALDVIRESIRRDLRKVAPPRSLTGADLRDILITAFAEANTQLLERSGGSDDHVAAASTCTAVLIVSNQAFIAHIGDSRAYLFRRGELVQLTSDESIVPDLVTSSGSSRVGRYRHVHPLLTRVLGVESASVAPKVTHYALHTHDGVMFCTDGAFRALPLSDLQTALQHKEQRAEWVTDRIVTLARAAGSVDNATVMLARDATEHGAAEPSVAAPARPRSWLPALVAMMGAALLVMSMMWSADTRLYLATDSKGLVTLYSGSPASVLGFSMHVPRTTYGIHARDLPSLVRGELQNGVAVASPAAAAALLTQWQATPRH